VSEAETNAVFDRLRGSLDPAGLEAIQIGADPSATPAQACLGARTMYDAIEQFPDADRRMIALADVTL
jgi:gamma-glutamylcysteine synthetase